MRNLPGSLSFSGNFLRRTAEQCSFNGVHANSNNFSLLLIKLLSVEIISRAGQCCNVGLHVFQNGIICLRVALEFGIQLAVEESKLDEPELGKAGLDKPEPGLDKPEPGLDKPELGFEHD
ncbi:hypothetical protein Tco_1498302 [Tanacetum coccineum]